MNVYVTHIYLKRNEISVVFFKQNLFMLRAFSFSLLRAFELASFNYFIEKKQKCFKLKCRKQ